MSRLGGFDLLRRFLSQIKDLRGLTLGLLVANFFGGALEAAFLAVISRLAFAVTEGSKRVQLLGAVDLSVGRTVVVGVGLIGARVGFSLVAAELSARVTSRVAGRTRLRLVASYFGSTWDQQYGDRTGRLQEIVSGHTQRLQEFLFACVSWANAATNLVAMLLGAFVLNAVASVGAVVAVVLLGSLLRQIGRAHV